MENLIFLDESGVNLSFIRKCARALSGERAYAPKPTRKGRGGRQERKLKFYLVFLVFLVPLVPLISLVSLIPSLSKAVPF